MITSRLSGSRNLNAPPDFITSPQIWSLLFLDTSWCAHFSKLRQIWRTKSRFSSSIRRTSARQTDSSCVTFFDISTRTHSGLRAREVIEYSNRLVNTFSQFRRGNERSELCEDLGAQRKPQQGLHISGGARNHS